MTIARVRFLAAALAVLGLLLSYAQPGFAALPAPNVAAAQTEDQATPVVPDDEDGGFSTQAIGNLTKSVSDDTPNSGDTVTYTVTFMADNTVGTTYRINDALPARLDLLEDTVNCTATVGTCVFTSDADNTVLADVGAGGEGVNNYDITVTYDALVLGQPGEQITNTACATNTGLQQESGSLLATRGFAQGEDCGGAESSASALITVRRRRNHTVVRRTQQVREQEPGPSRRPFAIRHPDPVHRRDRR